MMKWILSESGCSLITEWVIKFVQYQNILFILNFFFSYQTPMPNHFFSFVTEDMPLEIAALLLNKLRET